MDQHCENLFRPVTTSIPLNKDVLERSHLPCSIVLTPYARLTAVEDENNERDTTTCIRPNTIPAGAIARCQSCGATINPCSPILAGRRFMCGLCGEVNDLESPSNFDQMTDYERNEYAKRYLGVNESQSMFNKFFTMISEESIKDLPELNQHVIEYDCNVMLGENDRFVDKIPARNCPPLWIALVDLDFGDSDGTTSQDNITAICSTLKLVLKTAPLFVRFGLLVFTKDTLGVFDLTCRFPHLKQITLSTSDSSSLSMSDLLTPFQVFPSIEESKGNIESAIRALGDYQNSILPSLRGTSKFTRITTNNDKPIDQLQPLEVVLHKINEFIEHCGMTHPGSTLLNSLNQTRNGTTKDRLVDESYSFQKMLYAGGKIMTFLTSKESDVAFNQNNCLNIGRGGFGGSSSLNRKHRLDSTNTLVPQSSHDTINSTKDFDCNFETVTLDSKDNHQCDLWKLWENSEASKRYSILGERSASLALTIELFCLTCHGQNSQSFLIPTLRSLSERSGGCGPILIDTSGHSSDPKISLGDIASGEGGSVPGLVKEVIARSPWYRPCAFGATLKVRTSSTFQIETFLNDEVMTRHTQKGMFGNCVSDFNDNVWHFGSCDCDSTVVCDLQISNNTVEGRERFSHDKPFSVLPCIQTAFAYTSIIPSLVFPDENGINEYIEQEWFTVRKLRVFTTNMNVANNTEHLYRSLDAEALAVVLYHKLIISLHEEGIHETRNLGKDWLISVLSSSYLSASHAMKFLTDQPIESQESTGSLNDSTLKDRVIGVGSNLPNREILLAKGHEQLSPLPLLIFALLQCDTFRQQNVNYKPTIDARAAASISMANMTPAVLARCIAPRIDCWLGNSVAGPTHQIIDLNRRSIDDIQSTSSSDNIAFIIDSSNQIVVWYCGNDTSNNHLNKSDIMEEVGRISKSYRTSPPLFIINGKLDDFWMVQEALIEDSKLYDGKTFYEWCTDVADEVSIELNLP